jgi:hypothetical protein
LELKCKRYKRFKKSKKNNKKEEKKRKGFGPEQPSLAQQHGPPGPFPKRYFLSPDAPDPLVRVFSYLSTALESPTHVGNPLPHFPSMPNGLPIYTPSLPTVPSPFPPHFSLENCRQSMAILRRKSSLPTEI